MLYADQRWIGNHGIGRFARQVLTGLDYRPVPLTSHPAAPLDAWRLARALGNTTSNDRFFSPGYNTPLFGSVPFVFTIHDLSHVYCPENRSPAYPSVLRNDHEARLSSRRQDFHGFRVYAHADCGVVRRAFGESLQRWVRS